MSSILLYLLRIHFRLINSKPVLRNCVTILYDSAIKVKTIISKRTPKQMLYQNMDKIQNKVYTYTVLVIWFYTKLRTSSQERENCL